MNINLSKFDVLIVDDEETNINILAETLCNDYDISVAMDGESALDYVNNYKPDLVLLDIVMPGLDGYEVIRRLKAQESTSEIPVVFCTAMTEIADETLGLELGAVDYIRKPYVASVIKARVKTQLELAKARQELRRQNEILRENIELREQVEQITRHDLKNPLQAIMLAAQILANEKLLSMGEEEKEKILRNQMESCHVMLGMINRSLDLYKMEHGTYKLNAKEVDIIPVLDRILMGVSSSVGSQKPEIMVEINGNICSPDSHLMVYCDELLFYSMMSNLVKNAMEASPKGGTVKISFDEKDVLTIRIQNQGTVKSEIRTRFFEKFVTSGKLGGTGLGTYSARLMAEIHGGDIYLSTSDEEDKTVVTINLPKSQKK